MNSVRADLLRFAQSDQGTKSHLFIPGLQTLAMIELPWRENLPGLSCIIADVYLGHYYLSQRHGHAWMLEDKHNRTTCAIHKANFAGDESLGYECELKGCLAPGMMHGKLSGQDAVIGSRIARDEMYRVLGMRPIELHIYEVF